MIALNLNENLCLTTTSLVSTCSPPHYNTAIADTGATDHYFMTTAPLTDINPDAPRTTIRTATGEQCTSTARAQLAIPAIPSEAARTGHIIPGLTNNLLSLGKLCDAGCTAQLDKHMLHVHNKHGNLILTGHRKPTGARLWRVDIAQHLHSDPQALQATIIPADDTPNPLLARPAAPWPLHNPTLIPDEEPVPEQPKRMSPDDEPVPDAQPKPIPDAQPKLMPPVPQQPPSPRRKHTTMYHARAYDLPSVPALIAYLHAAAGYPVKTTWLQAIKRGAYSTWPGLTCRAVSRYCPDASETCLGHMAQPRQHIRPTNSQPRLQDTPLVATHAAPSLEIYEIPLNQLFTDDTGRFQPRSRSGNQYIMVGLHNRSNAILVCPFPSKHDTHRIQAYKTMYARLEEVNAAPDIHIMDNEASTAFQHAIAKNGCKLQLVPPHVHRLNAAERAIRTFKDHFLAILAGTAPTFPADRWDLLLPQAELTLNLLRATPGDQHTSAWKTLFGEFNFDATPMAPAGCAIHIHHKPTIRRSWDFRAKEGFYIGPALKHYRCYRVLATESNVLMVSDAVKFRPHNVPSPDVELTDKILAALNAINGTLARGPAPPSDDQLQAISTLRTILQHYMATENNTAQPTAATPGVPLPALPGVQVPAKAPTLNPTPLPTNDNAWIVIPSTRRQPRQSETPADPIAKRTRSHTNSFAALAYNDADDDTEQIDCAAALAGTNDNTPVACPVLDANSGKLLEHRQLRKHPDYKEVWDKSYANELGRLCQGVGTNPDNPSMKQINGTDTFRVIHYQEIPADRRLDVTYTRVVCEVRPQKQDPNRTRITIGGNRICYPHDTGTKTGSLELVKLQLNSVLSTPDARFACYDLENFYLGTPLDRPEYVRIQLAVIPEEFILEYNLAAFAHNGWVYFEIKKGVYGLKQAGKLANDLLTERLDTHGYYQCETTPGLWRHRWRPISFVLIVDDFGIKYVGRRHAEHLLAALRESYNVTTDWDGKKFAGIDITWDYTKRSCRLTMNGYIAEILQKYNHSTPRRAQHAPHAHREIIYGAAEQLAPANDTSPPLDSMGIKRIQGIIGSLLYYARAVDNKLLATLSTISTQQAAATVNTEKAVNQLLDYVATYPNDGITYRASSMVLAAHSDASYLTETNARSRAGAHIFLSEDDPIPRNNGPVLTLSQVLKFVMASAAEAELAALYNTAREMIPLRNALEEMGWKQPRSPIQTDNSTATRFIHDTIVQRRIKMIWMRLHWLRCRAAQGQFRFYWDKGSTNMADYHTKHHPPAYHLAHRATHAG